jgi:hypothetical protein
MWLTTDPTASFADTPTTCRSSSGTTPLIMTGSTKPCVVTASTLYYLKISMPNGCSGISCRYQLTQPTQFK